MSAWNFPIVFVPAVLLAIAASFWLIRFASGVKGSPDFLCKICGRRQRSLYTKEWRYCPYCGAPKGATSVADLPRRAPRLPPEVESESPEEAPPPRAAAVASPRTSPTTPAAARTPAVASSGRPPAKASGATTTPKR